MSVDYEALDAAISMGRVRLIEGEVFESAQALALDIHGYIVTTMYNQIVTDTAPVPADMVNMDRFDRLVSVFERIVTAPNSYEAQLVALVWGFANPDDN